MGAGREELVRTARIFGIDPGYGRCGWGAVETNGSQLRLLACGVIETPAGEPLSRRLAALHHELARLLAQYRPGEAAVEELFFAKNVKTAIAVGQARGVVLLACAQAGVELAEYKPAEIKLAVSGYGAAAKTQVQHMVRLLLAMPEVPRLDDASDALAVAICHAHSRGLRALTDSRKGEGA